MPGERCPACMRLYEAGMSECPNCGSSIPFEPNPPDCLPQGYMLGNRFLIGRVIGRGENSICYIAFDNRLQIIRCIKEFFPAGYDRRPDLSPEIPPEKEEEFRILSGRFLKEARIMSGMSEEKISNVVKILDQIERNGTTYILMEYLEGCTLEEWINRNRKGLSWEETSSITLSVLQTLEEIHCHGYLHRDLSLGHIFRTQDGGIRIIDFSHAEPIDTAKNNPEKMLPFSRRYYSPEEQVSNGSQGPWTDLYAVGAGMFRMLAGGWPSFQRNTEPFPAMRPLGVDIPEAADRIITKATQPDPKKRFDSAASMLDTLNKANGQPTQLQHVRTGQVKEERKKLPRSTIILTAVIVAAVIIGAAAVIIGIS